MPKRRKKAKQKSSFKLYITAFTALFISGILLYSVKTFLISPEKTSANVSELVTNNSFEQDTDGDGIPDGWQYSSSLGRKEGQVCNVAFSGSCSFAIDGNNDNLLSQEINISGQAGMPFDFSFWSKTKSAGKAGAIYRGRATFYDANGNKTDEAIAWDQLLQHNTFKKAQAVGTTSMPFSKVIITQEFGREGAVAWFDDYSLTIGEVATPTSSPPTVDTTPPTIEIIFPEDGSLVRANSRVNIVASAEDDVGLEGVQFDIGIGWPTGVDPLPPYEAIWKVPPKKGITYTIRARAFDLAGNVSSVSTITLTSTQK